MNIHLISLSKKWGVLHITVTVAPNPANDVVNIIWKQTTSSYTSIGIYDITGKKVDGLSESFSVISTPNDVKKFIWNTSSIPQGAYLYKLTIDDKSVSGFINIVR